MSDPSTVQKLKEMQARFILGIAHSLPNMTFFTTDEAGTDKPEIDAQTVLEKMANIGYEWHGDKLTWLNSAMVVPSFVFEKGESIKTIIARSYLAAIGKVKNIKINVSGTPAINPDTIDDKMEAQDFIWVPETSRWKWVGDDDGKEYDESATVMNESVIDEAIKPKPLAKEKFDKVKKDYSIVDVGEAQAKLLYRVILLEHFRKNYSHIKPYPDPNNVGKMIDVRAMAWDKIKDGGDLDPINGKMPIHIVEQELEKQGFEFNNNENLPMWVKKGSPTRMPNILSPYIDNEQDYIARGILATKKPETISIRSTNGINPSMNVPAKKIGQRIAEQGYTWHGDYGYIKGSGSNVLSKKEQDIETWLNQKETTDFSDMNSQDQKNFVKHSGYRQAAKIAGISPTDFLAADETKQNQMMSKMKNRYEFNKEQKEWLKRDRPVSTSLMNKIGNVMKTLSGKGLGLAKKAGSEMKSMGQYN
jgi:hypothetical protein